MKRVAKPVFFVVTALTLALVLLSFFGVSTQWGDVRTIYVKGAHDIRWGIDIRGGVDVTFRPPADYTAEPEQMRRDMEAAESIIKVRLVSQNITDYEVYTDFDNQRIIVRFPWQAGEDNFDPERAIQELGETALLTFREGMEVDALGVYAGVTAETIVLEGRDVASAQAGFTQDPVTGSQTMPIVQLTLTSEGAQKFAEATTRLAGWGNISIWMDEYLISAPFVNDPIPDGNAMISGNFTAESAKELADRINAGALPFKLETDNYNSISPTMGAGALNAMLMAGIIAFSLVSLFMLLVYRMPGFISVIALAGQVGIIVAAISGFFPIFPSFTLTLPGIAGIILSIGCGVDANVITAERIKEELRSGKTLDGAIYVGSKRAFTAIFDGNITMIIVAIVLMGAFGPPGSPFATLLRPFLFMFGPTTAGNIYSFGYTLLVGVIANFIMSVYAARLMLQSISRFEAFRNPKLYSGKSSWTNVNFTANSKKFFIFSGILAAVIIVSSFTVRTPQLDIQFRGGSITTYSYEGQLDRGEFESMVRSLTVENVTFQQSRDLATGLETMVVTMPGTESLDSDQMLALTNGLREAFPGNNIETMSTANVNAAIGSNFLSKSTVAVILASVLLIIYITLRFTKIGGLSAGVVAIIGLLHDVLVVFGVFIIFGIPINDNFIAVVLTILGYSINATIVIYDRIRENKRITGGRTTIAELVDSSLNQSVSRSVNTSFSTILALLAVTVVAYLYNVSSILTFAFPMIVGLISGTYTSMFFVGPLWVKWREYRLAKEA